MSKIRREYTRAAERLGARVLSIVQNGHSKMVLEVGDATRIFVIPVTSSDHRALRNFERDVKAWIQSLATLTSTK